MVAPKHNRSVDNERRIVAAEPPMNPTERGNRLLAQTRELALLPEGETLYIEGAERGWQRCDGFYVLACALLRCCAATGRNPAKIKKHFVRAAHAEGRGLDEHEAERQWENAEFAVAEDLSVPADGREQDERPMVPSEVAEALLGRAVAHLYRAARIGGAEQIDAMTEALNSARWLLDLLAEEHGFQRGFAVGQQGADVRDIAYVYGTEEPDEPLWFEMAKVLLNEPSPEVAEMLRGTEFEETDEDIADTVRQYRRRYRAHGSVFGRSDR